MWGKKKISNEAVDTFRKQIKEDETSTESLFQLKSAMHQLNPTYTWKCDNCSTSQKYPVFPSTSGMETFYKALQTGTWGEVVDSVREEKCKKCGAQITSILTLCEGCYEEYVAFIFSSGKGGGGSIKHVGSMKLGKCEKCGYRPQPKSRKEDKILKRYEELLEHYPEVRDLIKNLTESGLIKE
ncbi:hypothetical protein EU528_14780 [Candidatus Thorarchaeota archaeon]|nr:MAG: hypothetical protein EU528_14780 [Candidatus Thorarchaeota archaeon]